MDIELKEFTKGRPVGSPEHAQLIVKIKSLQKQKKFEEVFKQAKLLNEGLEKYLIIVNALLLMKKWHQLVQYCDKGLKIADQAQFYHLKGKAIGKLGNDKKKIQLIEKAIQINPKVAAYHRNLGAGFYSLKQYQKAITCHNKAIELEPNNAVNYHNLGSAYFRSKNYEKAKNEFSRAIDKNPKQALSYSWKGDCFKEMGDLFQAKECYQKAYDLTHSAVYLKEKQRMQQQIAEKKKTQKS